ncbi:hypothetical protein BpHYR1_025150 [Brachionus plicatilis]|uniref:Uncharacterized protein n=1 Tax=Brachionus plicatilis TaxID=10195 RepID=A0A3M7RUB6_BRAPC|nr:hypothetical protein BpHYR1_025150 [Brachionus plicatilis]
MSYRCMCWSEAPVPCFLHASSMSCWAFSSRLWYTSLTLSIFFDIRLIWMAIFLMKCSSWLSRSDSISCIWLHASMDSSCQSCLASSNDEQALWYLLSDFSSWSRDLLIWDSNFWISLLLGGLPATPFCASSKLTDLFQWFYQNFSKFTGISVILPEFNGFYGKIVKKIVIFLNYNFNYLIYQNDLYIYYIFQLLVIEIVIEKNDDWSNH